MHGRQNQTRLQRSVLARQMQVQEVLRVHAAIVREFGSIRAFLDVAKAVKADCERQRPQLIKRLAGNSGCAFSHAELEGMKFAQLVKLDASVTPTPADIGEGLRPFKSALRAQ